MPACLVALEIWCLLYIQQERPVEACQTECMRQGCRHGYQVVKSYRTPEEILQSSASPQKDFIEHSTNTDRSADRDRLQSTGSVHIVVSVSTLSHMLGGVHACRSSSSY